MSLFRRVIIESPYRGKGLFDPAVNIEYARECVRYSLLRGEAPLASHLLYTQDGILRDNVPNERKLSIDAGLAWQEVAHSVVVYTDLGISEGMQQAISRAHNLGIKIEYRIIRGNFEYRSDSK